MRRRFAKWLRYKVYYGIWDWWYDHRRVDERHPDHAPEDCVDGGYCLYHGNL
jgi:hypothetical protein